MKKIIWNNIKKIPLVNNKINDKVKDIIDNISLGFQNELTNLKFYKELPSEGLKKNEIENQFKQMVQKKVMIIQKEQYLGLRILITKI